MKATARLLAFISILLPHAAEAQVARDTSVDWLVSAGSEGERYLRALQLVGSDDGRQWSVRPLTEIVIRHVVDDAAVQPWTGRFRVRPARGAWLRAVQPELTGIVNSTFPYGFNDGAMWAGRGLTVAATAGVHGDIGPLTFSLAPQVFRAQNASFPLGANGSSGPNVFADPRSNQIDLPQRFGESAYQRVDPGQSAVQLRLFGLTAGASTANVTWGPGAESPFLLSNNAAGFAHLFAGTDGPRQAGPLRLQLRVLAARLDQSDYSPAPAAERRRYMTGVVMVGSVRQLPGLEVGLGRLFENTWPDSGISAGVILRQLVKNPFKARLAGQRSGGGNEPDNQIGSVFARWVFPRSGVEVYGELGREDNAADPRDLLLEPDHDLAYMVGLQRAWKRRDGGLMVLRGEVLNSAISHLDQVRLQAPPYTHTFVLQGHTQLGQVLGAPAGYAGGATSLAVDLFSTGGRTTLAWRRAMREPIVALGAPRDVTHALSLDRLIFRQHVDLAPEVTIVFNENRNGVGDSFNLRLACTGRAHW